MNPIKIYLSGKVSDVEYISCYFKFDSMERKVVDKQYQAINPMKLCHPTWSWTRTMAKCMFHLVFKADVLLLLSDWEQSKEAKLEYKIAKKCNKLIIEEENFLNMRDVGIYD